MFVVCSILRLWLSCRGGGRQIGLSSLAQVCAIWALSMRHWSASYTSEQAPLVLSSKL